MIRGAKSKKCRRPHTSDNQQTPSTGEGRGQIHPQKSSKNFQNKISKKKTAASFSNLPLNTRAKLEFTRSDKSDRERCPITKAMPPEDRWRTRLPTSKYTDRSGTPSLNRSAHTLHDLDEDDDQSPVSRAHYITFIKSRSAGTLPKSTA